jgi:pterin-4a-carbinolamine dehydratase
MAETPKPGAHRTPDTAAASRIDERLKAERIQGRLKAERIQGLLEKLPGWHVAEGGDALERTHRFPTPRAAAAFVALATEIGEAGSFVPEIDLRRKEVTVRVATDPDLGLTHRDFEVARRFSAFG